MFLRAIRTVTPVAALAAAMLAAAGCSLTGTDQTTPPPSTSTVVVTQTQSAPAGSGGGSGSAADSPASGPTATDNGSGVTIPPRPTRDDATVDARDFETENEPGEYHFQTPSGNVWCAIRPNEDVPIMQFGCQTRKSVQGPGGQTCQNNPHNSYAVRVESETIHFCTNQGIYTAEHQKTLAYGDTIIVMGDACTSTTDGMACWRGDHGFMISRDVNLTIG